MWNGWILNKDTLIMFALTLVYILFLATLFAIF